MKKQKHEVDYGTALEESYARWEHMYENGCYDPFYEDGVNLNLVRNHIIYYKGMLEKENSLFGLPDVYYRELPPEVDIRYMARPDEIRANAAIAMQRIDKDENLKFVREQSRNLSEKQLKQLCVPAVIGYGRIEAPSATTATTTTTVATTTTAATTTQATTTSAQTTAVTEQSEPAETTAVTTTIATTEPEVVEDEKPEPSKPETQTTPDGKYDLAETDLQNPDGTYTQDCSSVDSITVPDFLADKNPEIFIRSGRKSNPSKIPYSEITLENAAEAFPYLGFIGYVPDYLEILPTDAEAQIRLKVMHNLHGEAPKLYSGHSIYQYPGHYFSSEAEYNAYVADQKAQRAAADAAVEKERNDGHYGFDENDISEEELHDIIWS